MSEIKVPPLDEAMGEQVTKYLDTLTKPPGSLGRLEELVIELGKMTGEAFPQVTKPGVIVFAADHGITAEGVSAFPKEVTEQMVRNFLNGGAAINVFSRAIGAEFAIVDIGIDSDIEAEGLTSKKVRRGTGNFYREEAMTREEAVQALKVGYEEGEKMLAKGVKCFILGEMGIGNTTPSSAITAVLSGQDMEKLVGFGTGLVSESVLHKQKVITEAIHNRQPNAEDPIDLLSKIGGLEIAGMAGAMLAAASHRVPILVDGFIATVSALIANMIAEGASNYMFVGHQSVEPGHKAAAELLGKKPLVDLGMRLGEGTGAAVAFPILQAATLALKEMATFADAGVSSN
ncbi:nicotinate-nucleotide--dimethylbenzimidazole phosphoribosyltransferase [Peribacillus asahii]|uniref:Nicotinate-nucleotide--dimethylbenzimidazole phosphoribosyltransferase n=1 Tax=Peribacillus asahii TaxID=228899 RepID=A0A398B8T3_9BACI|nr:nicotinate-nucleotide--dimethylbenzimidazole phosphoribosyltransferase [Peribacillus asahii]RID86237.1 nicotinate-nucleotide--dimethylbenzimidazole phosphoribosyltransferase [Peribacillus asahii]